MLYLVNFVPSILRGDILFWFGAYAVAALAVFVIGKTISMILLGRKQARIDTIQAPLPDTLKNRHFLLSAVGVSAVLLITEWLIRVGNDEFTLFPGVLLYYGVFVVSGLILSLQCRARYVPLLFCLIVWALVSATEFVIYTVNLQSIGPLRIMLGLTDLVNRTNGFLPSVSIVWSSWMITLSIKAKPNKFMQPTSYFGD